MEYERIEPWGAWRDNWHAALLATMFGNAFRDPKRSQPMRMSDFFYRDSVTAQKRADQELLANLRVLKKTNG